MPFRDSSSSCDSYHINNEIHCFLETLAKFKPTLTYNVIPDSSYVCVCVCAFVLPFKNFEPQS